MSSIRNQAVVGVPPLLTKEMSRLVTCRIALSLMFQILQFSAWEIMHLIMYKTAPNLILQLSARRLSDLSPFLVFNTKCGCKNVQTDIFVYILWLTEHFYERRSGILGISFLGYLRLKHSSLKSSYLSLRSGNPDLFSYYWKLIWIILLLFQINYYYTKNVFYWFKKSWKKWSENLRVFKCQ